MNMLLRFLISFTSLVCIVWCQGCAYISSTRDNDNALSVLRTTKVRYTTDGAGGSDLTRQVAARGIVDKCKARLIPILIANLDNVGSSASLIDGHPGVSIGYVAFDLLSTIIEQDRAWYPDYECGDDGLWACVRADLVVPVVIDKMNRREARAARSRWQKLYKEGKVRLNPDYAQFWDQEMLH